MYEDYVKWCEVNRCKPMKSMNFSRDAKPLIGNPQTMRLNGKVIRGYKARRKVEGQETQETMDL